MIFRRLNIRSGNTVQFSRSLELYISYIHDMLQEETAGASAYEDV